MKNCLSIISGVPGDPIAPVVHDDHRAHLTKIPAGGPGGETECQYLSGGQYSALNDRLGNVSVRWFLVAPPEQNGYKKPVLNYY